MTPVGAASDAPRLSYGRQLIDDDDVDAVCEALRGDWLTQGPAIERFERAVAERVGAGHAVAFSNGTAALHGACHAGGLGPGDTVATSPLSFVASANCARYVGADVTFVDIDPATLNLDPTKVPDDVTALVAVHYAGLPAPLSNLSRRPRVVIEDAAHALGASTEDGPVGNCARSDMCCFSFHPVKPVTTAEGGVVTTNDDRLAERLREFRSHGIVRHPERGGWYYEVEDIGYNYRLTDLQAALGASQMRKLDRFIQRRREIAARYDELFAEVDGVRRPPAAPAGVGHGYHLYAVRVADRRRVYDALHERGIGVQVHYVPIHHHPTFRDVPTDCPHTDQAYEQLLSLPMHPGLTDDDVERVAAELTTAVTA
jgi:UDP-4-amino-4,6-dideoxy-N-acetyl-beta-L-altrosamine transaminase